MKDYPLLVWCSVHLMKQREGGGGVEFLGKAEYLWYTIQWCSWKHKIKKWFTVFFRVGFCNFVLCAIAARTAEVLVRHPETWRQQCSVTYAGWPSAEECHLFQRSKCAGDASAAMATVSRGYPKLCQAKCKHQFFFLTVLEYMVVLQLPWQVLNIMGHLTFDENLCWGYFVELIVLIKLVVKHVTVTVVV